MSERGVKSPVNMYVSWRCLLWLPTCARTVSPECGGAGDSVVVRFRSE